MRTDILSKEELLRRIEAGESIRSIARELGVSKTVLSYRIKTFNNCKQAKKPISSLIGWNSIRRRIFEDRGRVCELCGWNKVNPQTNIVPVQLHHKDGDRTNNNEDNLQILCPNCHSLTEHYMFYGRSHDNKYGQKGTIRLRS